MMINIIFFLISKVENAKMKINKNMISSNRTKIIESVVDGLPMYWMYSLIYRAITHLNLNFLFNFLC